MTKDFRDDLQDWEDLVKGLSRNAEKLGILVMRSGFVGHATSRPLDVFRVLRLRILLPIRSAKFLFNAPLGVVHMGYNIVYSVMVMS
jgi:hypothetical protein